jgi:hypothetical protein
MQSFWENYLLKLTDLEKIEVLFTINDSGDTLIRLKPKAEILNQRKNDEIFNTSKSEQIKNLEKIDSIENQSFFFYIPAETNKNCKEFVYFDSESDILNNINGVSMNESFIFFWNSGYIWSMNI